MIAVKHESHAKTYECSEVGVCPCCGVEHNIRLHEFRTQPDPASKRCHGVCYVTGEPVIVIISNLDIVP